jgi:hypothetical protein
MMHKYVAYAYCLWDVIKRKYSLQRAGWSWFLCFPLKGRQTDYYFSGGFGK